MTATRTLHATLSYVICLQQCAGEVARKRATKKPPQSGNTRKQLRQTVGGSIESEQ